MLQSFSPFFAAILLLLVVLQAHLIHAISTPISNLGISLLGSVGSSSDGGVHSDFSLDVAALWPTAQSGAQALCIALTPISGESDLCIVSDENLPDKFEPNQCTWNSVQSSSGRVLCLRPSQVLLWPSRLLIGVYGRSSASVHTFTINTFVLGGNNATQVMLENGVNQLAQSSNGYIYFKFTLQDQIDQFRLMASTDAGFLTAYVSSTEPYPNDQNYDASIMWTTSWSNFFAVDVGPGVDPVLWPSDKKEFFVGLRSTKPSAIVNVVATQKSQFTLLHEGLDVLDVTDGQPRYYKFQPSINSTVQKRSLVFSLDSAVGNSAEAIIYIKQGLDPLVSSQTYTWMSLDSISIDMDGSQQSSLPYYLAVYPRAAGTSATFRLLAFTSDNTAVLRDAATLPLTFSSNRGIQKYRFRYELTDPTVTLTLLARVSSSADVSTSSLRLAYKNQQALPMADEHGLYLHFPSLQVYGVLYFTLSSATPGLNVSLLAFSNASHTASRSEEHALGYLQQGTNRFFTYELTDQDLKTGLVFSASSWSGDVDLYLSNTTGIPYPTPGLGNYVWKSDRTGADTISISSSELRSFQSSKRFFIGIHSQHSDSWFSMLVYSPARQLDLRDGLPHASQISPRGIKYYRFALQPNVPLMIHLQSLVPGIDLGLYADVAVEKPIPDKSKFTGISLHLERFLSIPGGLPSSYPFIYIAVTCPDTQDQATQIGFQITVQQQHAIANPNHGQLLQVVPAGRSAQFFVSSQDNEDDSMMVSATALTGRSAIFVTKNTSAAAGPSNFDWRSLTDNVSPSSALILPSGQFQGEFRVGVFSVDSDTDVLVSIATRPSALTASLTPVPMEIGLPLKTRITVDNPWIFSFLTSEPTDGPFSLFDLSVAGLQGAAIRVCVSSQLEDVQALFPRCEFFQLFFTDLLPPLSMQFATQGVKYMSLQLDQSQSSATWSEAVLTLTDRTTKPVFLAMEQSVMVHFYGKQARYTVLASQRYSEKTDQKMRVTLESCGEETDMQPPQFFASDKKLNPSSSSYDAKSTLSKDKYVQELEATVHVASNTRQLFISVPEPPVTLMPFAMTVSPADSAMANSKPIIAKGDEDLAQLDTSNDAVFSLSVAKVQVAKNFASMPVNYTVHAIEFLPLTYDRMNMVTACGAKRGLIVGQTLLTPANRTKAGGTIRIDLPAINLDSYYMINVIAQIPGGLPAVFQQAWIVKGRLHVVEPVFSKSFFSPLSAGFFVLVFGTLALILYLSIGSAVQALRYGKRGWDVLPNLDFWRDTLPGLWRDGLLFLVSPCYRRQVDPSKRYIFFRDEDGTIVPDVGSAFGRPKQYPARARHQRAEGNEGGSGGYGDGGEEESTIEDDDRIGEKHISNSFHLNPYAKALHRDEYGTF